MLPKSITKSRIPASVLLLLAILLSSFHGDFIPEVEFEELNALKRHERFNFPSQRGYGKEARKEGCKDLGRHKSWRSVF